jgi:hypothetical protein
MVVRAAFVVRRRTVASAMFTMSFHDRLAAWMTLQISFCYAMAVTRHGIRGSPLDSPADP